MGRYIRKTVKGPNGSRVTYTGKDFYIHEFFSSIGRAIKNFYKHIFLSMFWLYKGIFKGCKWTYNKIKNCRKEKDNG